MAVQCYNNLKLFCIENGKNSKLTNQFPFKCFFVFTLFNVCVYCNTTKS